MDEGEWGLFFVYAGVYFLIGFFSGLVVYYALAEGQGQRKASASGW